MTQQYKVMQVAERQLVDAVKSGSGIKDAFIAFSDAASAYVDWAYENGDETTRLNAIEWNKSVQDWFYEPSVREALG